MPLHPLQLEYEIPFLLVLHYREHSKYMFQFAKYIGHIPSDLQLSGADLLFQNNTELMMRWIIPQSVTQYIKSQMVDLIA